MILCHYLTPQHVVAPLVETTKTAVIERLGTHLAALAKLDDPRKLIQAVLQREKSGTTFLPTGLAIPHARLAGITDIHMVLGLHPAGFVEEIDDVPQRIHAVCLFCSPVAEEAFGKHLQLLAHIASVFHDAATIQELAHMPDPVTAFTKLQQLERLAADQQAAHRAHPPAA